MTEVSQSMERSRPKPPGVDFRTRGQMWYLDDIREQLSESNVCLLRSSCFGHLFEIGEMQLQGELLNLLCRRLHSSSLDTKTLLFNFADHIVEFGAADFCVMTGLKFSGSTLLPKNSKFHGLVFSSRGDLIFADIEKEFRKECVSSGGNSVRSLKLAYLFIVYGLLVMNNHSTGKVDLGYLHLVDDVKNFNDFPWGLVAYEYLVTLTHRLKREMSLSEKEKSKITLEVYGFVYALQCWSFEVIPTLGTFCASLNPHHLKSFPRIIRWSVTKNQKTCEEGLWKFFVPDHGCDPVRLLLTSREIERVVNLGVTSSMHVASPAPLIDMTKPVGRKLKFDSGESHEWEMKKRATKRKGAPTRSSPMRTTSSKVKASVDCSITGFTKNKNVVPKCKSTRNVGSYASRVISPSDSTSYVNFHTPEFPNVVADANYNDVMSMFVTLKGQLKSVEEFMHLKLSLFEVLLGRLIAGIGCPCSFRSGDFEEHLCEVKKNCSYGVSNVDVVKEDGKYVTGELKLETLQSARITGEVGASIPRNSNIEPMAGVSVYDPNDSDFLSSELNPFSSWVRGRNKCCGENLVLLPTDILKYVDARWFDLIWRRDGWLENTHIDALTNMLIMHYDKDYRTRKPRSWTCMEICCWQALQEPNFADFAHIVLPYVRGERPLRGGVNWLAASHVYGVANINKCHWVLFDVSLQEQVITVYNSLEQPWQCIVAHFDHVRKNIPTICAMAGVWDCRTVSRPPLEENWRIVEFPNPPRQVNQNDCGIMVIKFMECLAYNVHVREIIPALCLIARRRYCAKLFKLSGDLKREHMQ